MGAAATTRSQGAGFEQGEEGQADRRACNDEHKAEDSLSLSLSLTHSLTRSFCHSITHTHAHGDSHTKKEEGRKQGKGGSLASLLSD